MSFADELRNLVEGWRNVKWNAITDDEHGFIEGLDYCADELTRVLTTSPKVAASNMSFVNLCIYERRHGTFATLGSRVLFGPFVSPTGAPSRTYKISIKALQEIIDHAVRTGEPE